jgi:hypothetical protein
MNILTIIRCLAGIYIVWAIVYLIVWGFIIRSRSSDYEGRTPSFGGVLIWILISLYPIILAIVIYALDRWIPAGNMIRNQIFSKVEQPDHLASIFIPALLIFTILSTACLFWIEVSFKFEKSHDKQRSSRAKFAYFAGWILDGALLCIAFYLFFGGEARFAAWLLWCNAGAYLVVRMAKAPAQWALPSPDYEYRFSSFLLALLLGLLRIGVIILGGWLYLSVSKLPIITGWLSKIVYDVDMIRKIIPTPSPTGLLGMVIIIAVLLISFDFVVLFSLRDRLYGKVRAWVVIMLSILPILIPILVFKPSSNPLLPIILLALGMVCGFLFLRSAPTDFVGLNSIYVWTFLYSLILGAVSLAYSISQYSYGVGGFSFMLVFQLFILMVGVAIGINARSLLTTDEIEDYYGH